MKRVRPCPYSATPHAHVGDCCEPGFEAGYAPPPDAYGPHPEDQPTPVSQGRLDAVYKARAGRTLSSDHWTAGAAPESTVKCPGICPRFTSKGSDYCCAGCRVQSEGGNEPGVLAAGDHPLLSHSEGCDERDQQRRPHAWQAS